MKAAELLISARGLPWQKLISLADRSSMSALAIMRQSSEYLAAVLRRHNDTRPDDYA